MYVTHAFKWGNKLNVIKWVETPGEDVYKPYDLFSNPDTLFVM